MFFFRRRLNKKFGGEGGGRFFGAKLYKNPIICTFAITIFG